MIRSALSKPFVSALVVEWRGSTTTAKLPLLSQTPFGVPGGHACRVVFSARRV